MPVLARVASISVSPGLMSPRASARMIIDRAGRSFTDPAGLLPSSVARMTFEVSPGMRLSLTSGVLPTKFSMDEYMWVPRETVASGLSARCTERSDETYRADRRGSEYRATQQSSCAVGLSRYPYHPADLSISPTYFATPCSTVRNGS